VSTLLGGESGQAGVGMFRWNDDRLNPQWFDFDDQRTCPRDAAWSNVGFATEFWPGGLGMDASGGELLSAVWSGQPEYASGASGFYGIAGVTRDVYGTVITGALVRLFRTSDSLLVATVVSDAVDGEFMLPTPYYPDAHYVVASKSGTPDVAGTSVQTLVAG
jgi:hypothetical protein